MGVKPGWVAVQLLVDDHVQIYFVPPEHNESLAGILAAYANSDPKPDLDEEAFRAAREQAWSEAAAARWAQESSSE